MKNTTHTLLSGATLLLALASPLLSEDKWEPYTQEENMAEYNRLKREDNSKKEIAKIILLGSLEWKTDGVGSLGSRATIDIPGGFRFLGSGDTSNWMKFKEKPSNGFELGLIAPQDLQWFAVFEFEDVGYVEDDKKSKLDPDEILRQLQKSHKAANEELADPAQPTLNVHGWYTPPFYNTETNNLEWAIRLSSSDGREMIHYNTKLLGRKGVMNVVLYCSEEHLASVIPKYQRLLAGYSYQKDESYAAFTKGDKIAEYDLVGLITGDRHLVSAKSGLLLKLLMPITIGFLAAIGAFLIFRGKNQKST